MSAFPTNVGTHRLHRWRALVLPLSLAVVTTAPLAQSPKQVVANADATLPFSTAISADGLIYVAGALARDRTGDVKSQTKQVLDSIDATLKKAGSRLANAASVTVYLRNQNDFAAMNDVYRTFWTKDPPARTTVIVPLLNEALIEISAVAVPDNSDRVAINPPSWLTSNPYSYGIRSGSTLFMSGLISRNGVDNTVIPGDIAAQTKTVLDSAARVLEAAGMTLEHVVSSRVYLTDRSAFDDMNRVYRSYFPKDPPARAAVRSGLIAPDYLVEIAMVAVKSNDRRAVTAPSADGTPGRANPNLSSAIQAGNRLYVSGMLGNTPANSGDVAAQTTEAMARIGRTLKSAGLGWSAVVDATVFLPDLTQFEAMNAAYRTPFEKAPPARATIGAGLMAQDAAIEIMFTAVK